MSSQENDTLPNRVKGGVSSLPPKPTVSNKRKFTAACWKHFTLIECSSGDLPRSSCNYCGKTFKADSDKNGTSSMNSHLKICKVYLARQEDPKQKTLHFDTKDSGDETLTASSLVATSFSQEYCRKMLATMVVLCELPFIFVESEGFIKFCKALQPRFVVPSRITVAKDCYMLYMNEKKMLKSILTQFGQRVCLTTDTWTSIQNINYLVLTAHFIDDDWKLHKRILNFCQISNHKGETIGRLIEKCLQGWGINRFFTITVDNASSNDVAIAYLVKKYLPKKALVLGGEFVHVRCSAHILNLILGDGLKDMDESIIRIRNAVKYIRGSPARLQLFKDLAKEDDISIKRSLCLDVVTRWNATYLMLDVANKFQKTFERLEEQDGGYLGEGPLKPNSEDWENSHVFVQFLKVFYETTLKFSSTLQVTSNKFFEDIVCIKEIIRFYSSHDDKLITRMAQKMQAKFDKYWSHERTNYLLYVASVLDPRFKMNLVKHCLNALLDVDVAYLMASRVEQTLRRLCDEYFECDDYENINEGSKSQSNMACEGSGLTSEHSLGSSVFTFQIVSTFKEAVNTVVPTIGVKEEVDRWLEEPNIKDSPGFCVLTWWKMNGFRFKTLSKVAKDVFSIPISTVASESAFSTGGRVLDPYRSTLSPKTVESLICAQNWLRSTSKPISVDFGDEVNDSEVIDNAISCMMESEGSCA